MEVTTAEVLEASAEVSCSTLLRMGRTTGVCVVEVGPFPLTPPPHSVCVVEVGPFPLTPPSQSVCVVEVGTFPLTPPPHSVCVVEVGPFPLTPPSQSVCVVEVDPFPLNPPSHIKNNGVCGGSGSVSSHPYINNNGCVSSFSHHRIRRMPIQSTLA
jgi:hypothetical protein